MFTQNKTLHWLLWLLFLLGLIISILMIGFAKLPNYQTQIERWLNTLVKQPITIGNINTYWTYGKPTIELQQLRLLDNTIIELAKAKITLDIWESILQWQLITKEIIITGSKFSVIYADKLKIVGLEETNTENNQPTDLSWLIKQPYISLHADSITWLEPKQPSLIFSDIQLSLTRQDNRSKLIGSINLPEYAIQQFQAKSLSFTSLFKLKNQQVNINGQVSIERLQYAKSNPQSVTSNFQIRQQIDGTWQTTIKQQIADLEQWLNHKTNLIITPPNFFQTGLRFLLPQANLTTIIAGLHNITGQINYLSLEKLIKLLPLPQLAPQLVEILSSTQGDLYDVKWNYDDTWQIDANFSNLNLLLPQAKIQNFSGHLLINSESGQLHIDRATVALTKYPIIITRLQGSLDLKRWMASTDRLQAVIDGIPVKVVGKITMNDGIANSNLLITVGQSKLKKLVKYIPNQDIVQQLTKNNLTGSFKQAKITLESIGNLFKIKALIKKLTINNYQLNDSERITIQDLTGQLEFDTKKTSFTINQGNIKLDMSDWYSKPLILKDLNGKLLWQQQTLTIKKLQAFKNNIQVNGSLKIPQNGQIPYADLIISLNKGELSKVANYLPNKKIPGVVKWFKKAQFIGNLNNTKAIIRGSIDNLLEQFYFKTYFTNTSIKYANGWPQLTQAKGQIIIKDQNLTVKVNNGKSLNLRLAALQVKIASLFKGASSVDVTVNAKGSIADSLDFVANSPLQNTIKFDELDLQGKLGLELDLSIPLRVNKKPSITGQLLFDDTRLYDKSFGITVTDITGKLKFDQQQVSADNMQGKLRGTPIKFSMFTKTNQLPQRTTLKVHSLVDPEFIAYYLQHFIPATSKLSLSKILFGTTPLDIKINFPNSSTIGNNYTDIEIQASLKNMFIKLPRPIGKITNNPMPLAIKLHFDSNKGILLKTSYGKVFNNIFYLKQGKLERGNLVFGTNLAKLPKENLLTIEGTIPNILSVTAWTEKFNSKTSDSTADSNYKLPIDTTLDLKLDKLEVAGQELANVKLHTKYVPSLWQAAITSDKIVGKIEFDQLQNKLALDFTKLILAIPKSTTKTNKSKPPNPHHLPIVIFNCDLLKIADINLGTVQLNTKSNDDGLKFNLATKSPTMDLQTTGQWRYVADQHQTRLKVTLNSDNIGNMLQQFGYSNPPIVGEAIKINLNSYWFAAPYAVDIANLVGTLSIVTMAGNIVDIDPGIGRIFGLFDVYSLPRRLNLDFRDVFGEGFGFDTIVGNFFIKKGIASIKQFILQGPSARVKIDGSTDILNKKYDQLITVYPHFSTPIAVAGTLALGLSGGAAALIIQQALQVELEPIINFQYHITGDWDKPEILPVSN
ncbi:MAG: AsmA-like C-terminal region-containing protein [Candidatus Marithrix sp.]